MKKVILSDEEFNKLPSGEEKSKKVILSDEQMAQEEDPGKESDKSFGDIALEGIGTVAEYVDRYTGAPVRAGIGALQEGEPALSAAYEQIGRPTSMAPTGKEIAQKAGISDDVLIEDLPLIGDVTKSGAAGLAIETLADPTIIASGAAKAVGGAARAIRPVRLALKGRAARSAFKSLAQISTDSKIKEVFTKSRPQIVGQQLLEADLGKHLNNPAKLLEKIKGKETTKYVQEKIGKRIVDTPTKSRTGGLISDISKETDEILRSIDPKVEKVDVNNIISNLSEREIRLRLDPESASKFSPKDIESYDKALKAYLKPVGGEVDMRSVTQLQNLKKDLGKKLSSKEFFAPTDKKLIMEKTAMLDIYHELKRAVENAVDGVEIIDDAGNVVDAGLLIGTNNQKISSLMDVGNLLENIPAKEMRGASTAQKVVDTLTSAAVGTGAAAATGSPAAGVLAAGAYGASSKLGRDLAKKVPGVEARMIQDFITGKSLPAPTTPGLIRPFRDGNEGREPQSLPEQLVRTPLPRTTEEVLANKDFVIAKTAQQAPEFFDNVKDALDNDPEAISELLPVLAQQFPFLFARDKYNRVDGKILAPEDKARATNDTMNRDDLSNHDKIMIINELNKTGVFHDR